MRLRFRAVALTIFILCATTAHAARVAAPDLSFAFSNKRVVFAQSATTGWTTDLVIDGHFYLSSSVPVSNCLFPRFIEVPAYGAAIVPDLGSLLCGNTFGLLNIGQVPATVGTVARYRAGSDSMTVYFPALESGIVTAKDELRAGPVANGFGGYDATFLSLFNDSASAGDATVIVFDAANQEIAREYVSLPPGLTFYRLQTAVAAGSVRVRGGVQWGGSPILGVVPTYGWAVVGPPSGAVAPRVIPLTPVYCIRTVAGQWVFTCE